MPLIYIQLSNIILPTIIYGFIKFCIVGEEKHSTGGACVYVYKTFHFYPFVGNYLAELNGRFIFILVCPWGLSSFLLGFGFCESWQNQFAVVGSQSMDHRGGSLQTHTSWHRTWALYSIAFSCYLAPNPIYLQFDFNFI